MLKPFQRKYCRFGVFQATCCKISSMNISHASHVGNCLCSIVYIEKLHIIALLFFSVVNLNYSYNESHLVV